MTVLYADSAYGVTSLYPKEADEGNRIVPNGIKKLPVEIRTLDSKGKTTTTGRGGQIGGRFRQYRQYGTCSEPVHAAGGDFRATGADLDRPLADLRPGLRPKDASRQFAERQRRRRGAVEPAVFLQNALIQLRVGDVRILVDQMGEREGEEAIGLLLSAGRRQCHLGSLLPALRRKKPRDPGAVRRRVAGNIEFGLVSDPARSRCRRISCGFLQRLGRHPDICRRDRAADLAAARHHAGMATVEDGPDKGALGADLVERRSELVIGDGVLDRPGRTRPAADVDR